MLIAGGADIDKRFGNPHLTPLMLERYMTWLQELRNSGRYAGSFTLHDQTGRRLTVRGGQVIDGPFIESKDAVGGVFIVEAASLDEAAEIARSCPILDLQNGYMEVRVIEVVREAHPASS
ncbi:MAG TPA: YciI family protein [Vicinamibacterales bacterium]|nr:YciI family protein [Vicinamibacterales bacterium]